MSGNMADNQSPTISIDGVMVELGVSRATVMRMLNNGTLRSVRVGRRRIIDRESVNAVRTHGVARVRRSA